MKIILKHKNNSTKLLNSYNTSDANFGISGTLKTRCSLAILYCVNATFSWSLNRGANYDFSQVYLGQYMLRWLWTLISILSSLCFSRNMNICSKKLYLVRYVTNIFVCGWICNFFILQICNFFFSQIQIFSTLQNFPISILKHCLHLIVRFTILLSPESICYL